MKLVLFLLTMKVSQFHCLDYIVDHTHSTVGSKLTIWNVNSRETHRVDHTKMRSKSSFFASVTFASSEIRSVRAVRLLPIAIVSLRERNSLTTQTHSPIGIYIISVSKSVFVANNLFN